MVYVLNGRSCYGKKEWMHACMGKRDDWGCGGKVVG